MKKLMIFASAAFASAALFAEEAAKEIGALDQWMTYLKQGGNTMFFIGALSILGIGCALERFWNMRRAKIVPDDLTTEVIALEDGTSQL